MNSVTILSLENNKEIIVKVDKKEIVISKIKDRILIKYDSGLKIFVEDKIDE